MLAGSKGERLHRPPSLPRILGRFKEEIIEFAVDRWDEYSPDWLAQQVVDIWWEDLPENIKPEQVEPIIWEWDSEIRDRIKESSEPTPREEAIRDIMNETMKGLQ